MRFNKTNRFLFLLFSSLVLLSACDTGYVKNDGKWYYKDWNESWGRYYEELHGVDNQSFKVRKDGFGMDMNSIWVGPKSIGADPLTFVHIKNNFYKDVKTVFYIHGTSATSLKVANSASFRVLAGEYALDGSNAYYQWKRIPKADVQTFSATSEYYAVDKNHVWYKGQLISHPVVFPKKTFRAIDRKSFADLGDGFAEDKIGKICMGYPIEHWGNFEIPTDCRQ